MSLSRRDFGKVALAALPASRLLAKTDSKFGGVQIGINAPYTFHGAFNSGDECLGAMVKLNLSSVELRAQPIEQFMGAPANLVAYPAVRPPAQPKSDAARRKPRRASAAPHARTDRGAQGQCRRAAQVAPGCIHG